MIISVSRRTDIPAFYMQWFLQRIQAGKVVYYNPFNFKGYEISLRPEDVDVMVFISKNYVPLLPYLTELQKCYNVYFHYTITGLSGIFEESVPPAHMMVEAFKSLASRTSPAQVEWRFDPIILTNITPPEFYRKKFLEIVQALAGYTTRCYFSFATLYDKVKRTFQQLEAEKGVRLLESDVITHLHLVDELASIGKEYGIQLYSCCNDFLRSDKVQKGRCIDGEHLSKLFGLEKTFSLYPTRKDCGCAKCIDIGIYDTCPHGCSYCYANFNKRIAKENFQSHSPTDELIAQGKVKIVKRLPTQGDQLKLF